MQRFLDKGEVELIPHDSNYDLRVVNAARVSFGKRKDVLDEGDVKLIHYLAKHNHWTPFAHSRFKCTLPVSNLNQMMQLLRFLGSPEGAGFHVIDCLHDLRSGYGFVKVSGSLWGWLRNARTCSFFDRYIPNIEHRFSEIAPISTKAIKESVAASSTDEEKTDLSSTYGTFYPDTEYYTLRIKLPIFVARQLMRSNVGIVYNEVSRRYVDDTPEIYVPDKWRARPEGKIKQGSSDTEAKYEENHYCKLYLGTAPHWPPEETACEVALIEYEHAIESGVAPELARIILPQATYTELWATFTKQALDRVLGLRSSNNTSNHAQYEIRMLADAIKKEIEQ